MSKACIKLLVVSIALLAAVGLTFAGEADGVKDRGVAKTMTNDSYGWVTINNVFNWYGNNGNGSYNTSTANSGLEFPKGSEKWVIFEDGVVWGGFHKGRATPKVGGSTYRYALQAGKILTPGTATTDPAADSPTLAKYRVYRVRPDVTPKTAYSGAIVTTMEEEAGLISRYNTISASALFAQYQKDWNEWPAIEGMPAPYKDVNKDGKYDPAVDIPGQPGADQTLYYVANDMSQTRLNTLSGSPPIGLEMHRTVWGYNLSGALGNTIFASTLVINKSGAPLDSAYFVQWSDPDLGEAGDDFAGCDTKRSLGFIYNGKANDPIYGKEVPAAGYDFFQGPIVKSPGDSAVFQLKYRQGFKNLGMSTFVFFINGNATYTDPALGSGGDEQWYRLMNGRISSNGAEFINPITKQPTVFTLDGDPVTGQGWLDGTYGTVPGDRRICLVTGPFTLADKDTQELVVATIAGVGSDRISSVAVLKYYSDLAQYAYNGLFNIPRPPASPTVAVAQLDGEAVLSWESANGSATIENYNSGGYAFEGYNVYQFPEASADLSRATRLATYDLINSVTTIFDDVYDAGSGYVLRKPVQFGTDSGIKRFFSTKIDVLNSNTPLRNGSTYYFGVSAYSFNSSPTALPTQLESVPNLLTVIPQSSVPGTKINASTGQEIIPSHSAGISTAEVSAKVVDPTRLVPRDYEVRIVVVDSVYSEDLGKNVANPKFVVYDKKTNTALTPPMADFNFSDANLIVDGVQFGMSGAPFYVAGKELGSLTWKPGKFPFTGVNDTPYPGDGFINSALAPQEVAQDVEMEFTAPGQGQSAYMFLRTATGGSATAPYDGFYPQQFKVYELNPDGTRKQQIDFVFMEQVTSRTYDKKWWPGSATGDREYWFFVTDTYTAAAKAKYAPAATLNDVLAVSPCVWSGWYTRAAADSVPTPGSVWTIKTTKIITTADRWTYSTQTLAPTLGDATVAKADVERVNVFPNPYIGFNPQEANKYQRFVTFNHLPVHATLRMFNLAGVLVRTLMKSDNSQFLQWDLRNEDGFPVAAGMYIVHIEMPDQGMTKVLKLGVIPEQQFIDRW